MAGWETSRLNKSETKQLQTLPSGCPTSVRSKQQSLIVTDAPAALVLLLYMYKYICVYLFIYLLSCKQ